MRIGRTLPPAAAPIDLGNLLSGIRGILAGQQELERFRAELKEHFGVKHCFLVSSGKAAFTLILLALKDLSPDRNEVLIPAFTCYSVPSSIVRAGLRVRLCDLHPDRLDFDFAQLSALLPGDLSPGLLAVVPTHLFGFPADVANVRKLVKDPAVTIVEDAAQAMGEEVPGGLAGTVSDVSFFSLGRGKAFSVVEGGVILTNRDNLAERLDASISRLPRYGLLRLLGLLFKAVALTVLMHPWMFWLPRSLPFLSLGETLFEPHFPILRMSSFQAGLAGNWRPKLDALRRVRQRHVNRWRSILAACKTRGPHIPGDQVPGLLRYPLRISDGGKREALLRESAADGMGIMPVYPASLDAIPELHGTLGNSTFPVAASYARELVTLPTHGYVMEEDMTRIRGLVSRVLG